MPEQVAIQTLSEPIQTAAPASPAASPLVESQGITHPEPTEVNLNIPNIDFSDFQNLKEGIVTDKDVKAQEKQEAQEAKKPGETEVEHKDIPDEQDDKVSEVIQVPDKQGNRDYTGLDEAERKTFRSMSKEAFEKLKPIYIEHKTFQETLKAKDTEIQKLKSSSETIPANYYNHPEAFILSPQFKQSKAVYDAASYESRHWEQQLANVESGRPWQDLDIDPKTGNYITSAPQEVTDENRGLIKSQLTGWITQARLAVNDSYGKMSSFVSDFQKRSSGLVDFVKQQEEKFFPAYKDPNFKGWKFAKEFEGSLLPELREGNPIVPVAAKLYATVQLLIELNNQLKADNGKKQEIRSDQRQAGPTGNSFVATGSTKPPITFDDFKADRVPNY